MEWDISIRFWFILFVFLTTFSIQVAFAVDKPLYEFGVMGGAFHVPDYPASDNYRQRFLVLPFGIYRGEVIRADRDGGMRSRFLRTDDLEVDVSLSGSFPARSDGNNAREGMPDLVWLGELGPRVVLHGFRDRTYGRVNYNFPIRFVGSTDFGRLDDRGIVFAPNIDYRVEGFVKSTTGFSVIAGLVWATRELHEYFYEVPIRHQASGRPAYEAKAGFMQWSLAAAYYQKISKDWWWVVGTRYSDYREAANTKSPLFKVSSSASIAFGLMWRLIESDEKVKTIKF